MTVNDITRLYDELADIMADRATQTWRNQAACAGAPAYIFFPGNGGDVKAAKEICETCPVQAPCGEYAARQNSMLSGVWASSTKRSRMVGRTATAA